MKKHYFKITAIVLTTISIILFAILIFMKTYAFKNEDKNPDINSKIISEIDFVDSCVVEAMNKLNNISVARYKVYTKSINKSEEKSTNSKNEGEESADKSKSDNREENKESPDSSEQEEKQSQTNSQIQQGNSNKLNISQSIANNSLTETNETNINWNEITFIYENLYSTWPTINIDLKKIGIKEEQISKFNIALNGVAQSINSKDKNSTLVNLYNIYIQLPVYMMVVTQDSYLITSYNTKAAVLNAYTLANEENKWKEISESVAKAKNNFATMYEIIDEKDNRRSNIEKTNTIINDLENCIVLNDKNIFYMQYKNVIQALETL